MMRKIAPSDASTYYREDATGDVARMDSSALHGNLADAMKNAIVVLPSPQVLHTFTQSAHRLERVFVRRNPSKTGQERPDRAGD